MADADLIQLDGFAIGRFARVLSHHELGTYVALAIGQGDLPPGGAPVFVDVGEAAGGGILPPVLEHPEAQRLLIESERFLHIPDAEGYMRHPYSWHPLSFPCAATLRMLPEQLPSRRPLDNPMWITRNVVDDPDLRIHDEYGAC